MPEPPPSDPGALWALDATAQADLVRSGEVTASALVEDSIARIERLNPLVNAVIEPLFENESAYHANCHDG